ncbi:CPK11, partial [Symbiodinium sp. KB8]
AVFHFFDSSGHGIIRGDHLHLLFPARPEDECALMIRQSCGKDSMSFVDFQRVMTPANWKPSGSLAKWADVPDVASPVLGPKPKLLKEQQRGSSSDPERECQCQVTSR